MILGIVLLLLSPLFAWLGWKCFDYACNSVPQQLLSNKDFTLKLLAGYGSFFGMGTSACLLISGLHLLFPCT